MLGLRNMLTEPRLRGVDLESDARIPIHRQILSERKIIRDVFFEMYNLCISLDEKYFTGSGRRVEVGAGGSLFKNAFPEITTTDIVLAPNLDLVVDAQLLPFPDKSIRAVYGINCFHHFPSPQKFFSELDRVLVPGGGCVLIEPYYGPFAGFLWKRLFDTERFDKDQLAWEGDAATMGAMSGANIATSYIIFKRDRKLFEQRNPNLEIVIQEPISNYVRYLMSGALNFRPLVPTFMEPALRFAEVCLRPLAGALAIEYATVLRKKQDSLH